MICKIYNDGSHYIAVQQFKSKQKKPKGSVAKATELDVAFEAAYKSALENNLNFKEQKKFVRESLSEKYNDIAGLLNSYIDNKFKAKLHAIKARKKRFERKAYLNKWNYFITFTYDSKKCSQETFEKSLRRCLSNLSTRRGWLYMMREEKGGVNGRKHYHALVYIPEGQMIGHITKKRDYSKKLFKSRYRFENDFFLKFGRNDFQKITDKNKRDIKQAVSYIIKYMGKSNDKTYYSRGIPTEIYKDVSDDEIHCEMVDFIVKYVIFDGVFERDNIYSLEKWYDCDYYDLSEFEE